MRGRRTLRRLALLGVVALLSACATSKKAPPQPKPSGPLAPQAFFWEATGPNGAKLFLLGSVHIGDGRELILDDRIQKDWNDAQELVVELDATSMSDIDAVDATTRFGLLPKGTALHDVVSPDTYKQVVKYMKQHDFDMTRVDRMRPWLVAQIVTQLEYTAAGLDAENGVDMVLMRRASGRKAIVPLETLDGQAALFAGLPAPLQETMLIEILREAKALLAVTRATLTAWEEGDESTLSGLLFSGANSDPQLAQFYEQVFYARNRAMAERLVALSADTHPRFVVVGTGHLIGTQGIPALLAQRGFQIERLGSARVVPGTIAGSGGASPAHAIEPAAVPPPTPTAAPIAPPGTRAPAPPVAKPTTAPTPVATTPATTTPAASAPATPAPAAAPPTQPAATAAQPATPAPAAAPTQPAATAAQPAATAPAPAAILTTRPGATGRVSRPAAAPAPAPAPVEPAVQPAPAPAVAQPSAPQPPTPTPAPATSVATTPAATSPPAATTPAATAPATPSPAAVAPAQPAATAAQPAPTPPAPAAVPATGPGKATRRVAQPAPAAAPPSPAAPVSAPAQAVTSQPQPAPTAKTRSAADQSDSWLGQDAAPPAAPSGAANPPRAPAAVAPAPAPSTEPAPAPEAEAEPAPKKPPPRMLSRPK